MFKGSLLLLLSCLFYSNSVLACSCASSTVSENYSNNDVVFIGKVEDISEPFILDSDDGLYQVLVGVKLSLIRSFKGEAGKEITIFTRSTSAACGYTFKKGIEYAVFSHSLKNSVDNRLFVSGCGSTIHTDKRDNPYERERIQVLEYLESK